METKRLSFFPILIRIAIRFWTLGQIVKEWQTEHKVMLCVWCILNILNAGLYIQQLQEVYNDVHIIQITKDKIRRISRLEEVTLVSIHSTFPPMEEIEKVPIIRHLKAIIQPLWKWIFGKKIDKYNKKYRKRWPLFPGMLIVSLYLL